MEGGGEGGEEEEEQGVHCQAEELEEATGPGGALVHRGGEQQGEEGGQGGGDSGAEERGHWGGMFIHLLFLPLCHIQ